MCGFKSFADRTKLVFEPGLIAIVGPNGCGKSNVSDSIRWVLGEQRPSALRGSKMLDVIFNGTDTRKPMSMAEVSITFADCDKAIDTEFNEITVTRRVFRTGDSAYYLNKSPCRLKDIQRLFMGTGIGTTSYSVMAQGQIDAILSSRPEDRRTIFEEAAGVTKYKADRKEAMRKLEQTEANLVRLADVIREVKRQIGNLQRQVGKAQRYKELKAELRGLDIFASKAHIVSLDARLSQIDAEYNELNVRENSGLEAVTAAEAGTAAIRAEITENEDRINAATEAVTQAEGNLSHSKEIISIGEQRIEEYRNWAERDAREASQMQEQLALLAERIEKLKIKGEDLQIIVEEANAAREAIQRRVEEEKRIIDQCRRDLSAKRDESMERERRTVRLQNQIAEMESRHRNANLQRERLIGEHDKLKADLDQLISARNAVEGELETLRDMADEAALSCETLEESLEETRRSIRADQDEVARQSTQIAARRAKIDLLKEQEAKAESFQSGSKMLLDPSNPLQLPDGMVLGPLADKFKVSSEYRPALEAVLRAWIDAVVLKDISEVPAVMEKLLASGSPAPARLIAAEGGDALANAAVPAGLTRLADHVQIKDDFREAGARLLQNVFVAGTLDSVPATLAPGTVVVTLAGAVFRSDGICELWMAEGQASSPLARRMAISDGNDQIAAAETALAVIKTRLGETAAKESALLSSLTQARRELDELKRSVAQKEGEFNSVNRDAKRSEERIEVVSAEMRNAIEQTRLADEEKNALSDELQDLMESRADFLDGIAEMQAALQDKEAEFSEYSQELTEARLREANKEQELSQTVGQIEIYENRRLEVSRSLEGRSKGVASYDESIARLTEQIEKTRAGIAPLQMQAEQYHAELDHWKQLRTEKNNELIRAENRLNAARQGLDAIRNRRSGLDVEKAEISVKRQNRLDRIFSDYSLTPELFSAEPPPQWDGDVEPPLSEIEARILKLNEEITAIGPVNLVAIEEYQELEERYALEKAQEDDLLKSKEQILDLLRMINQKSSEMFKETFDQANANFEKMFSKLFNGGTAKLVLIENPEDPLECGVEIIARPPGKRLQSISLLSGGERTMTAVSLLFAIYQIKPSPFCLLDELDAALDDSNIGRFVQALKDFLVQSQFLIITHNQHSIANSGIVYGVTMPEKGVSRLVSMRLPDIGVKELEIAESPLPQDAPAIPEKKSRRKKKDE